MTSGNTADLAHSPPTVSAERVRKWLFTWPLLIHVRNQPQEVKQPSKENGTGPKASWGFLPYEVSEAESVEITYLPNTHRSPLEIVPAISGVQRCPLPLVMSSTTQEYKGTDCAPGPTPSTWQVSTHI